MLVMNGGRERTEAEFCALVDAAGFELTRIVPTMAPQSMIEAVPKSCEATSFPTRMTTGDDHVGQESEQLSSAPASIEKSRMQELCNSAARSGIFRFVSSFRGKCQTAALHVALCRAQIRTKE
jgi:hypothetical protein